ncbi:MAG: hypothetical protein ABJB12_03720 [Pseudomonadota bacterium]
MGAGREQQGATVYYKFQDSSGRLHIVDSLESVPQAMRPQAQRLAYGEPPSTVASSTSEGLRGWPMFALGFGAALLVVLIFKRLPGTMRIVLRLAIVAGIVCLLGGGYLSWARRATGLGSGVLASPQQIIDDAKNAVAKMNARQQADQAELKEIEQAK